MPHSQLARLTQIDYDREMAFVAIRRSEAGAAETVGVVRTVADTANETAELSIVVRTDLKRRGLGSHLLRKALEYGKSRGTGGLAGDVLAENESMLELAKQFPGFRISQPDEQGIVRIFHPL
jgi:L-amino acid N-acyltransferase YncA